MAECIERTNLIARIRYYLEHTPVNCGEHYAYSVALKEVLNCPAADVVPVVRCKDCKHKGWVQEPCHGESVDYCKIWDCTLRNLEATFCSYGEQKDGGASNG